MADATWRVNIDVPGKQVKNAADMVSQLEKKLKELQAPGRMKQLEREIASFGNTGTGVLRRFARGMTEPISLTREFGRDLRENWTKLGEFLEYGGAIALAEGIRKVVEGIIDIGKEAVVSAGKAERMNRVISIATGGAAQGAQTRAWLDQFSKTSEFSEAQNESAFVALKKVGFQQEQAGLVMKAAADVAAVSEDKNAAYQEAISAFQRVQISGRVTMRQLLPLGIGIQDIKALDQFKGMNTKALRKAMESGSVDQADLFKLIMARTNETKLGQRSADNMNLLGTKMEKISELPERFWKRLADTRAVGMLTNALDGILEKLDPESPAGARIFSSLEAAFGTVADAIGKIDMGAIADTLADDIIPGVKTFIEVLSGAVDVATKLASVAKDVGNYFGAGEFIEKARGQRKRAEEAAAAKIAILRGEEIPRNEFTIASGMVPRGELVAPGTRAYHGPFHMVGEQAATGVADATPKFNQAGASFGRELVKGFRDETKTHSPSLVFEDLGAMTAAGYAGGVMKGKPDVDYAMDHTFGPPAPGGGIGTGAGHVEMNLTISPTIHVGRGDGEEQGRMAADAFSKRVRGEVLNWLEEAGLEGGLR